MNFLVTIIFCVSLAVAHPAEFNQSNHTKSPSSHIALVYDVENCRMLCGCPLINNQHLLAPRSCVHKDMKIDRLQIFFVNGIEICSVIKRIFYLDFAILRLNKKLYYQAHGVEPVPFVYQDYAVPTVVNLVSWNEDWDVETHDVKIIKLDKEIRLDNYHVKNMPHDVQMGRFLVQSGSLVQVATVVHDSGEVGYLNIPPESRYNIMCLASSDPET